MTELLSLLFGALLTLIGVGVKDWLDRRAHSSNRVYELRIEALNAIWQAFNEMKGQFALRQSCGYTQWQATHAQKAGQALNAFRRAIDNAQIVLPAELIDVLRKIDGEYFQYSNDESIKDSDFSEGLKRSLAHFGRQ